MQKKPSIDDFINQAKDKKIDIPEKNIDELKRQTYYISEIQRQALAIMAAHEDRDKSEIVRQALKEYIPDKYIKMAMMK